MAVMKRKEPVGYAPYWKPVKIPKPMGPTNLNRYSRTYNPIQTAPAPKRVELKHDDGLSSSALSAGTIILLSSIAQGAGDNQRIGKFIHYHSMNMNYYYYTTVANITRSVRVVLVYDKQPNGTLPASTDILETTSPFSLFKEVNRNRFNILFDKIHYIDRQDTVGYASRPNNGGQNNVRISLKGKKACFYGATSGIADLSVGAIYLLLVSDGTGVTLEERNRIRYHE